MPFDSTEQEIIVLNAAWAMIDDMVNFALFCPFDETKDETCLLPRTEEALRLFNILLTDFLSPLWTPKKSDLHFGFPSPQKNAGSSDSTFLFYIQQVCKNPSFDSDTYMICQPVSEFSKWLEEKSMVGRVWLPSIEFDGTLRVERRLCIRICGDILKHNFLRLNRDVKNISELLSNNGHEVDDQFVYMVLPEFSTWFHENVFAYHATTIAEYLNNIRWGIYDYLQEGFFRACHPTEPASGDRPGYGFQVPEAIKHPFAQSLCRELMDRVIHEPFFPRFSVPPLCKIRY